MGKTIWPFYRIGRDSLRCRHLTQAAPRCPHAMRARRDMEDDFVLYVELGAAFAARRDPEAKFREPHSPRRRSPHPALGRPALPLVAEQMDLVAAGGLGVVERNVGFREQFGDLPAMRSADEGSSHRDTELDAKTVPE